MTVAGASLLAVLAVAVPGRADQRLDEARAKAAEHIAKGRPEEALKTMLKLVAQSPTAEAYTELGRLQERLGELPAAGGSLRKAVELSAAAPGPARAEALTALATLELRSGAGRDALTHAQEAAKLQPTPASLAALARALARVGTPAAAREAADQALRAGATSAEAHDANGDVLLAAGKPLDAAASYQKALSLDPNLHRARVGLARALLAAGKTAEAAVEAQKTTEADPKSGAAFAVLGLAILAENTGRWGDAIAQAQQGAFLEPRSPYVQTAVGRIFEGASNVPQAIEAYKRALETDPDYGPARAAQVIALAHSADVDEALKVVGPLAQSDHGNADVQLVYGRLLARKGDWVAAAAPLARAAQGLPRNAEAQALAGTAFQYTRQSAEAMQALAKAVALDPKNVNYRVTYGLVLGLNKRYAEGIAELNKVVATPGYKDSAGYTNLGWNLRSIDPPRGAESVAAYRKALELDAKNAQAALGLGWALSLVDKHDDAIAAFASAIRLEPKLTAEANNGTAWAYYFKGDMANAKAVAAKAKAQGRNVASLVSAIERFEKGQAAAASEARRQMQAEQQREDLGAAGPGRTILNERSAPAARIQAIRDIVRYGAAAVEYLIYAAVNDADMSVRDQALKALGELGPAARGQCAQIKQIAIGTNPYDSIFQSDRKTLELQMQYGDLQRTARDVMAKIGCS
jgi:tetratricopeptide (TPR) repeat protein